MHDVATSTSKELSSIQYSPLRQVTFSPVIGLRIGKWSIVPHATRKMDEETNANRVEFFATGKHIARNSRKALLRNFRPYIIRRRLRTGGVSVWITGEAAKPMIFARMNT
jgi:hypothetical protein